MDATRIDKLGVTIATLDDHMAPLLDLEHLEGTRGVVVISVDPGSLAAEHGVEPKDVIVGIGSFPVAGERRGESVRTRVDRRVPDRVRERQPEARCELRRDPGESAGVHPDRGAVIVTRLCLPRVARGLPCSARGFFFVMARGRRLVHNQPDCFFG